MIEIRGIKIPVEKNSKKELERQIKKRLRLSEIPEYHILKKSIDARKKPAVYYIYHVGVAVGNEERLLKRVNDKNIMSIERPVYRLPEQGTEPLAHHPVVIGAGPAGLFCGLLLAKMGYVPVIVERGSAVSERKEKVERFWETGVLDPDCNVQFGEGGAGTFSDGKLNTQIKDKYGRIPYVLDTFVRHGAPEDILYDSRPHIGTDRLLEIVKGIRKEIESEGGVFLFDTKAADFRIEDGKITAVKLLHKGYETWVESSLVVLAIGHSARDTISVLHDRHVFMQPKDFAVGIRIEHKARMIQRAMYGEGEAAGQLPAAPYKLAYRTENGRNVYSFCMCPGGYVVNASSEPGHLAVNGMSYSGRDGENSNSAIVVSVKTSDYTKDFDHPLSGMEFQRKLEAAAFHAGNGRIPVQRFEDFCHRKPTESLGAVSPEIKGTFCTEDVRACLPEFIAEAVEEGVLAFERNIEGFSDGDALLSAVESRTSSPVRILRDGDFLANIRGIYPCGEGAGYAGGIVSAAVDGLKVAEAVIGRFRPDITGISSEK